MECFVKLGLLMASGKVLQGRLGTEGLHSSVNALMISLIGERNNMKVAHNMREILKITRNMEEVIFLTIIYTIIGILRHSNGDSHEGEWRDAAANGNMVYT
jgi:hypothetical protein